VYKKRKDFLAISAKSLFITLFYRRLSNCFAVRQMMIKHLSFLPFGQCRLRIQYHTCLCCVNGLRNLAQKAEGHYL